MHPEPCSILASANLAFPDHSRQPGAQQGAVNVFPGESPVRTARNVEQLDLTAVRKPSSTREGQESKVRIGEIATRSGVSAKTIRYYEDIGLLQPPPRTASGYRDYEPTTVDRLAFVRAAQAVGLTLGEIRGIVALRDDGETPCNHVLALLRDRAAELDRGKPLLSGRTAASRSCGHSRASSSVS